MNISVACYVLTASVLTVSDVWFVSSSLPVTAHVTFGQLTLPGPAAGVDGSLTVTVA